jgi:hypothetical protein
MIRNYFQKHNSVFRREEDAFLFIFETNELQHEDSDEGRARHKIRNLEASSFSTVILISA